MFALRSTQFHRWKPAAPWLVILGVVLVWLAPITFLGRMPIGGDVTSFFLPIMSYYHRALAAGRIPLWNELWGFGFPVLAESQTGVFYPPHLVLFGLFETELAYSLNIVLHFVLAGWFAYICGRAFGLKQPGATLTGLIFAGNGFFIIHFPHQWSYTTGCWLPLAVALAWQAIQSEERRETEDERRKTEDRGDGSRFRSPLTKGQPVGVADRDRNNAERGARNADTSPASNQFGTPRPMRRRLLAALGLALVLAVQMLAGHFQIAFYTQVVVLLLGLVCSLQAVANWLRNRHAGQATAPRGRKIGAPHSAIRTPRSALLSLVWVALPLAAAFAVAAVQILPSYELIRIALPGGRDFEYLSGFANTPLHLVSYLFPTLFHVNPLWRPVAWDPFHTSPEECFSYIGLLPLCLALAAAWRWRREPRVRIWVLLAAATLVLSLGPYMPGFRALIRLPGFGGFRSASRWSIATALFLALLAGRAVDGLYAVGRLRHWLRRFTVLFVVAGVPSAALAFALAGGQTIPATRMLMAVNKVWQSICPWGHDDLLKASARAKYSQTDLRTIRGLADLGYRVQAGPREGSSGGPANRALGVRWFTLDGERYRIMLQEFVPPIAVMMMLWMVFAWLPGRRRVSRGWLLMIAVIELGAAGWLRPIDFTPRGDLARQSDLLSFLAKQAAGHRVLDSHQNLAMVAGAAPVRSYRTVDLPILVPTREERLYGSVDWSDRDRRRCDIRYEVWDGEPRSPLLGSLIPLPEGAVEHRVRDPLLGRILFGPALARTFPEFVARFVVWELNDREAGRAWFWDAAQDPGQFQILTGDRMLRRRYLATASDAEQQMLQAPAKPVRQTRADPEWEEFVLEAENGGAVILTELDYPGWDATLVTEDHAAPAEMRTVGIGCRAIMVPGPGTYRVQLRFRSRSYELGAWISGISMLIWLAATGAVVLFRQRHRAVAMP